MSNISDAWNEIKVLVDTIDADLGKHMKKGSVPAGVRARKGLRLLKVKAHELVKLTIDEAHASVAEKTTP